MGKSTTYHYPVCLARHQHGCLSVDNGMPQCQYSKVWCHAVTLLANFMAPAACFDKIHLDIVGPLPPANNCTYILTCIDRYTQWPEAFSISDITTKNVACTFVSGWIARFGGPFTVTTDCSRQFTLSWAALMQMLGAVCIQTTAYHPAANGLIECFY